jgi:DNA transformation protein
MFGGAGIYRDGLMFGLISDGDIFLKCDDLTEQRFRAAGSRAFVYGRKGETIAMWYWSLPEEALDDGDALKEWAEVAWQAALRARAPKRRSRPPRQARGRKNHARQD